MPDITFPAPGIKSIIPKIVAKVKIGPIASTIQSSFDNSGTPL